MIAKIAATIEAAGNANACATKKIVTAVHNNFPPIIIKKHLLNFKSGDK